MSRRAAQYKTVGGRTSIDEILDLDDSADQQRQVNNKYIRSHQKRPEGLYAPGMQQGGPPNVPQQMMAQELTLVVAFLTILTQHNPCMRKSLPIYMGRDY